MNTFDDMLPVAAGFHEMLPDRIREYLNGRGIPDATVNRYLLGWDDRRITIPITNREGIVSFFKLAKDPADTSDAPKMLTTVGASMDLYGWEHVMARTSPIIICEGEFGCHRRQPDYHNGRRTGALPGTGAVSARAAGYH